MGHSRRLLDKIAKKLERDYPPGQGFDYFYETRLKVEGRKIFPDIIVMKEGINLCVVEIGYTRPEKLRIYKRELGIEDVRWYGKNGELYSDVEYGKAIYRNVEITTVRTTSFRDRGDVNLGVLYLRDDDIHCPNCYATLYNDYQSNDMECDIEAIGEVLDICAECFIVFNRAKYVVILYCDVCDEVTVGDILDFVGLKLFGYEEALRKWNPHETYKWSTVGEYFLDKYNTELDYNRFHNWGYI